MNKNEIQARLKAQLANGDTDRLHFPLQRGTGHGAVETADSLACSIYWLEYASPDLERLTAKNRTKLADSLASRLTYLLEPICTIETDPETVQLRSQPPHRSEDGKSRSYFELLVGSDRMRLTRYHKQVGQPRLETTMQLTHEVVARLFQDFDSATAEIVSD